MQALSIPYTGSSLISWLAPPCNVEDLTSFYASHLAYSTTLTTGQAPHVSRQALLYASVRQKIFLFWGSDYQAFIDKASDIGEPPQFSDIPRL